MEDNPKPRRSFLKRLLLALIAPVWAMDVSAEEHFPTRTIERTSFAFDPTSGLIRWSRPDKQEPFQLTIDGLVESPVALSYAELRALPQVAQVSDFHCVEGWTVPSVKWGGVRFSEILKLVKPAPGASFVVFHSLGETSSAPGGQRWYVEGFSVADLLDPEQDILLTLDMDGRPLPYDRGAPLRIIAPLRQAYKSAKFVHRIEFTNKLKPGWWTLANPLYDTDAKVPAYRLRRKGSREGF